MAVILSNLAMDEGRRVYFNEIDKMGRGEERAGKGAANGLAIGVKISRKARDCLTWRRHSCPMPLSFRGTEHPAWIVGQDGILRAGWQPAPAACVRADPGGFPTRHRFLTCPTTSVEFPFLGKLSGVRHLCLPRPEQSGVPSGPGRQRVCATSAAYCANFPGAG